MNQQIFFDENVLIITLRSDTHLTFMIRINKELIKHIYSIKWLLNG